MNTIQKTLRIIPVLLILAPSLAALDKVDKAVDRSKKASKSDKASAESRPEPKKGVAAPQKAKDNKTHTPTFFK